MAESLPVQNCAQELLQLRPPQAEDLHALAHHCQAALLQLLALRASEVWLLARFKPFLLLQELFQQVLLQEQSLRHRLRYVQQLRQRCML